MFQNSRYFHFIFTLIRGLVLIPVYLVVYLFFIICNVYPIIILVIISQQQKDIHKFVLDRDLDSLREYIRKEKDVNLFNYDRDTALHLAVQQGNFDVVSILVDAGAEIDLQNKAGATPLNIAAFLNRNKIADLLIQKGASNDIFTGVCRNDITLVRELLEGGENPNSKSIDLSSMCCGVRPILHLAVMRGYYEMSELLIKHGADSNEANHPYSETPLDLAIGGGYRSIVELLVINGADVNRVTDVETPLHQAVEGGNLEIVKFLLSKGAQIDAINSIFEGDTPLHQAVMSGNTEMVVFLLENGANPHLKNNFLGVTPLILAQKKNSQIFEAMLRYTEDCE